MTPSVLRRRRKNRTVVKLARALATLDQARTSRPASRRAATLSLGR